MLRHIPNFLTCCNLLCGTFGILYTFHSTEWITADHGNFYKVVSPAHFVWMACVFDFFDGFTARILKVSSPIGKELDSLADVVSFGLLPSLFVYRLIGSQQAPDYLAYTGLLIVVFSALRLAKFNIDTTQTDSFKGLPVPANAIFITGLPFMNFSWAEVVLSPAGLVAVTVIFSLLLVSRIELFALKFKDFTWQSNKIRFTYLLLSVLLIALFNFAALPLIIILYILLSLGKVLLVKV